MSCGRFLAVFLCAVTGLRWWWNLARPLSADEAYLALCGFIPSFAFFDGPGGTPWLVALGISFAGSGGFGATIFWPVLAALASAAIYFLVAALSGRREGLAVAVLLNLLPVFNAAALSATCAMALAAAALGTSLCAWYAIEKNSAAWWAFAGLCTALGLIFSYTAWFLLPALSLVLLASHRWRKRLLSFAFWMAWVPPVVVYALLLSWNEQHGWVHFIGGTWRTAMSVDAGLLPRAIMAAANGLTPFVLVALCIAAVAAMNRLRISPKIKFVAVPALAAAMAAIYASLRGSPAQSSGLLAISLALPLVASLPARAWMKALLAVVFLGTAAWTALNFPRPARASLIDAAIGQEVESLRAVHSDAAAAPVFLIAENAPLAAALSLALPDVSAAAPGHPPVYTIESAAARSQFDLWPRYDQFVETTEALSPAEPDPFTEQQGFNPFVGRSALYVTTQQMDELPQAVTAAFSGVRLLQEIPAPDGQLLRVYLCSDYQTMPL